MRHANYAGDVQAALDLTQRELPAVARLTGVRVALAPALAYEQVSLNQSVPNPGTGRTPPWIGDPAVGLALDLALDRPALLRRLSGAPPLTATPVSPLVAWAYDAAVGPPGYDLERARRTLDQDGWTPGPDGVRTRGGERLALVLTTVANQPLRATERDLLAGSWRRLGVDVRVQDFAGSELFGSLDQGGVLAEAALWSWITPVDPDGTSRSIRPRSATPGTWRTGGWPRRERRNRRAATRRPRPSCGQSPRRPLRRRRRLLTSAAMEAPLLRVEGLRTYFYTRAGAMRAVDGVDLTVGQGRTLGLVGESGCGKTVTSLSIMRLVDAPGRIEPGSKILFDGRDLATADEDELREVRGNNISMIFQEPMTSLNPVYAVGDQIAEAVRLHQGVGQRAALDRAIEMLKLVGIPSPERRIRDYPHQMSGGMRQRVMIAMALSCDPKLLIADEPTTALDVTIQAQILELMKELRDRLGMAIMLITHDLGVVAEMADEVAVMYAGRVVERGPVEAIFNSPQHPYTEALLQSIPVLGMTQAEPLRVIRGMVPSPMSWPAGCRFATRCDYAFDRCRHEDPPLFEAGATQHAACWLCERGPRAVVGARA